MCDASTVQETELQDAVAKAINVAYHCRDTVIEQLKKNIEEVLSEIEQSTTKDIDAMLEDRQKELLKRANGKEDYSKLADEIERLRDKRQEILTEAAENEGCRQRIGEMMEFLNSQKFDIEDYDEALVRKMIEKVTIYDFRFEVEFKAGISIDVER